MKVLVPAGQVRAHEAQVAPQVRAQFSAIIDAHLPHLTLTCRRSRLNRSLWGGLEKIGV